MPEYTIELSDRAAALLATEIDRTNQASGAALEFVEWIELHLREVAIARDLAAAIEKIREEHERKAQEDFGERIKEARERLLTLLDQGPRPAVDGS